MTDRLTAVLHGIAKLIDRQSFELPEGAIEGRGWEVRRQWAIERAILILALLRQHDLLKEKNDG
jgi:hypothetical protein